ncbi:unnamed protein product [Blepharisma stoltei]|uniref:Uncharacterized protein n=1 Tax=Blepharisma stoltei TaxID=1481888 RepID=A0AAU9IY69_9CILI|nr:unnamed protein product [Blepharisma stoltei]
MDSLLSTISSISPSTQAIYNAETGEQMHTALIVQSQKEKASNPQYYCQQSIIHNFLLEISMMRLML